MDRVLIVGGTSFVGRHLGRLLQGRGWDVLATCRGAARPPAVEVCDLICRQQVDALLQRARPAWVVDCAGATAGQPPADLYELHVHGTLNLLAAAAEHVPSAPLLLFGSAAEYGEVGPAALPVSEDQSPAPLSFFGASKLAQTEAGRVAAVAWGLRMLVVRPFNIIGPGLPDHYLAAALSKRVRAQRETGDPVVPVANGKATRDWVDVRDVAQAVVGLMERAVPPVGALQVYNIASGIETPVLAVAQRLCACAGGLTAVDAGTAPSRSSISRSCGNASRLRAATGWQPTISWEQSIDALWRSEASGGVAGEPGREG
jgi:GDP-4-dehydro-6-deoxy-D-mannose reductase